MFTALHIPSLTHGCFPSEFLGPRLCHFRGLHLQLRRLKYGSIRTIHVCRRQSIPRFAGVHDIPTMRRVGMLCPHRRVVLGLGAMCRCGVAQIAIYRSGRIFRSAAPLYTLRSPAAHDLHAAVIGTSRNPRRRLGHMLRRTRCRGEWSCRRVRMCCSVSYRSCCGGHRPGSGGGIRYGRLTGWP